MSTLFIEKDGSSELTNFQGNLNKLIDEVDFSMSSINVRY